MNFYKRFIGDIQAKTGGLTLAQFGAYDRLLDHYYSTETAIPADEVYRICRAMSAGEREAVDKVLAKFFELGPEGYSQSKADEVIAKAQPLIEAARANGKKGGRPPKQKTQEEPAGFQNKTQEEPSAKAIQSQSQFSPNGEKKAARKRADPPPPRPEDVDPQVWDDWNALRARKGAPVTKTVLEAARDEAESAGLTLEAFLRIWCLRGSQGLQADWLKPHEIRQFSGSANKHSAAAAGIFGSSDQGEVIDV